MRKDESKISEHCKHTRKRKGLRRRVNKAVRRNVKADLAKDEKDNAYLAADRAKSD